MFEKTTNKFNGIYRGKVLSNSDPLKLGRIKVQVYPMFATLKEDEVPWCVPAMPLFEGAGEGIGSFCVPDINSFVFVFFEMGDLYQPVYFAEAQTKTKGLPSERITNYPNRKIWKTSSGITIYIDDTAKKLYITCPSDGEVIIQGGKVIINPI